MSGWETVRAEYLGENRGDTTQDSSHLSPRLAQNHPLAEVCSPSGICVVPGFPHVSPTLSLPGAWHMAGAQHLSLVIVSGAA